MAERMNHADEAALERLWCDQVQGREGLVDHTHREVEVEGPGRDAEGFGPTNPEVGGRALGRRRLSIAAEGSRPKHSHPAAR